MQLRKACTQEGVQVLFHSEQNCQCICSGTLNYSRFRDIMFYICKGGKSMAVTYKKLFHLLIDKGMTNAELMEKAGFSANIITRIKRDNYVSLDTIEKICKSLQCNVDDILEFTESPTENRHD